MPTSEEMVKVAHTAFEYGRASIAYVVLARLNRGSDKEEIVSVIHQMCPNLESIIKDVLNSDEPLTKEEGE